MSKTERAIRADLAERRTLLVAERDRALAGYHALTGALNEIERLLSGFDQDGVDEEEEDDAEADLVADDGAAA
jgi:hypothetical protein